MYHKKEFGRTHNIEFLIQLCSEIDDEFKTLSVGDLSFYAVEVRYPDDFYVPTLEEAQECYTLAMNIKNFILKRLNIE